MLLRFRICIPVYDNPTTIEAVVLDCLKQTRFPILVVDDGSEIPVQVLLRDHAIQEALDRGRIQILRFQKNRGKGHALRTAIDQSVQLGFTHLISVDGDGQHLGSQIQKMVHESSVHPWRLIIGNRQKTNGKNLPRLSRFGRWFSNSWTRYQTDFPVQDSQSGMRVYPLFHLQNLRFFCTGYEFEIEILVRLLWRGILVREVPIDVWYPPRPERVSHFRKFRDNARITLLNTFLIITTLIRNRTSPSILALSIGLGVCIGTTPFFGFHALIACALAFFLRLNAVALLIGTQISIPPLAPLLAAGSFWIADQILGLPISFDIQEFNLEFAQEHLRAWLAGSAVLGASLGIIIGLITFIVSRTIRARIHTSRPWSGRTRGGRFGNALLKGITRYLGLAPAKFILFFLAPYFYLFAPKARKASLQYWSRVDPKLQKRFFKRQFKVVQHFYHFGCLLLDRLDQSFYEEPRFETKQEGFQFIQKAVSEGKGLIVLGAHIGSWDLASAYMKEHGVDQDFFMVQFETSSLSFQKIKKESSNELHRSVPLSANQTELPILTIKKLLDEGLPIGILADRPMGRHYELVPFLGGLVAFDATAMRIAHTCQTPVILSFGFKTGKRSYRFQAGPPQYYRIENKLPKEVQIYGWVADYASQLEQITKENPLDWNNFFDLWADPPQESQEAPPSHQHIVYEDLLAQHEIQTEQVPRGLHTSFARRPDLPG